MSLEILLSEEATDDLFGIWFYIATNSGTARADAVEARLRTACRSLADFPSRGSPHDELEPGLRSIAFERRATIFYRTGETNVEIVRILYAGLDADREFGGR